MISTGEMVWELVITGQLFDKRWASIALRWKKPNLDDLGTPVSQLGGLEMFINGERVGRTLLAQTKDKDGTTQFKMLPFKIDGKDPPVISLGCAWNYHDNQYDYHSGGEYDELALWTRQLIKNATMNELSFMMGGYCK